jgi:hypothetical protein
MNACQAHIRNVEVDPDKLAILRSPETQNLLVT